ncbi:sulfotransferase domain-containing protein [Candidatus Pelagibacter sp. Uisw_094]|uniref:sulfotransferase domain-containing protein n=1 Tax=Candidatus Pelagibacter sp. Uisw_094 TaxID=3230980 RepID=UPI0039EA6F90|tara:strand:+ start:229 stop:1068 length:840 start_codon:yes stop_codon:yes gene_type:complete
MIVWLASYPKSGNTWIRIFLSTLLYSSEKPKVDINKQHLKQFPNRSNFKSLTNNFLDLDEIAKNSVLAQDIINLENGIKFYKTHSANWKNFEKNYYFTNYENSLGVIHIVRDPRNVITSILDYYDKENYQEALNFLIDRDKVVGGTKYESGVPTILLSWADHYNSWKVFKKNYLLVKYENLLTDPVNEFLKIANFLSSIGEFNFEKKEILELIENCKFEKFSNQEESQGFIDNSLTNKDLKKKFFKLGPNNNWKKLLDPPIRLKIEEAFKNEMNELKYL